MTFNVKLKDSYKIYKAALDAADAYYATKSKLRRAGSILKVDGKEYDLRDFDNLYVVGAGKASAPMTKAVEDMLADKNIGGRIIVKYGYKDKLQRIIQVEAGHPFSDENGVLATRKIINLLEKSGENDLIICLLSGGASSLLSSPASGITLEDTKILMKLLFEVGADISEVNIIRKHISMVKGGRLARYAYPAKVVTLILSDVLGDDLEIIGSGPTVPDSSTYLDAINILKNYKIFEKIPDSIKNQLSKGLRGEAFDAPKKGDKIYNKVQNVIVTSLKKAISKAEEEADFMNYKVYLLSDEISGDVNEVASEFLRIVRTDEFRKLPLKKPACIIAGGETTVKVRGEGKGGRNTELALIMARELSGLKNVEFLSCGTDGTDGITDAAGAICDGDTMEKAGEMGVDAQKFLENSDPYSFFEQVGGLVKTGPTRTNVNDIYILLIK